MTVLRAMTLADLDALLPLQRDGAVAGLGHIFPQDEHPFPTPVIRSRWESELADPEIRCWVVVADGAAAGFAAIRGSQLLHLGTAVSSWGSGLAGTAHDEVVAEMRADGTEVAWLKLFDGNERARRFYVRRGWRGTGQRDRGEFAPYPTLERYELDLT